MTAEVSHRTVIRHLLPDGYFAELSAGRGGRPAIRELWDGERSRRLLVLKALLDEAGREPSLLGPLPGVAGVWEVLKTAETADRAAVTSVLMHPQVGTWAAYALRRQRGGAQSPEPLWTDFGQVHSVALVAAARAGIPWQTRVPLRSGRVMLPALGMATFPGTAPSDTAEAQVEGKRITLRHGMTRVLVPAEPGADAPGWHGLRRIRVGHAPALCVFLEDLDPFRDFSDPEPPARLDDAALQRWRSLLSGAWELLCRDHRDMAEAMAECVVSLVPLPTGPGGGNRSGSTGEAFGMVLTTEPADAAYLAETLVHEFSHLKLGALNHLVDLSDNDPTARYFAPWRYDPRPIGGLLQGIYAFTAIAAFWRTRLRGLSGAEGRLAAFEFAYARGRTYEALRGIGGSSGLTVLGRRFADRLRARIQPWMSESVPAKAATAAELVRTAERSAWHFRNLEPHRGDVLALATARIAGVSAKKAKAPPNIWERPPELWTPGRAGLARLQMTDPEGWRDRALAEIGSGWAARLTEADVMLMAGELAGARTRFSAQISADPGNIDAWSGLATTMIESGSHAAAWAGYPELIRAVHAECAARGADEDLAELSAWIKATPVQLNGWQVASDPGHRPGP